MQHDGGRLAGKVAIVTGGGGGIGGAIVRRLAGAGAKLVVGYYNNAERAQALVAELRGDGHRAFRVAMEDSDTIAALADFVQSTYGRADILVNSAGWTRPIAHWDLAALDDATIDSIFVANVRGPFATVRAFEALLRRSGDAVIINISSVASVRGTGSNIAYAASKAALDTITKSLARVLGPEIRIMSVSPAGVDTDFVRGRTLETLQKAADKTPLGRLIGADDVARTTMAIILDFPLSTGAAVLVDGGQTL